ncbi:hypothetical protein B296_00027794 [Ensete ventricosum]|uniref:Uncharacterized protein n=1 Tax=Ensete ventricosum TaxID=4639 RepID=A0A426YCN7_ENSVE|nr:hypothetical protein B296_00027794 [Ensete ventricosum]
MRLLSTQPAQHPTLTIASMATATLCAIVAVALFYSGAYTLPQADLAKRSAIRSAMECSRRRSLAYLIDLIEDHQCIIPFPYQN